jgi:hypothetical protein
VIDIDFELAITGLCVIVPKSKDDYPKQPDAVDVLCVGAHHHRPTLSFWPEDMEPISQNDYIEPSLCVDPTGRRIASLDISNRVVSFTFGNNQNTFSLAWGPDSAVKPPEDRWMNWIAPVNFLGIKGVRLGKPGEVPEGAGARLTLQPGEIEAKEIILNHKGQGAQWEFPSAGKQRALANQVIYRVPSVDYVKLHVDGIERMISTATNSKLTMSLSNDLRSVPYDYNLGVDELYHLSHLAHLAEPPAAVVPPKLVKEFQRTGKPICNQVLFVDKS